MVDIQYGIGDYPEDATHENGNYMCVCVECGDNFIGHKRRVICKHCLTIAKNTEQLLQPDTSCRLSKCWKVQLRETENK